MEPASGADDYSRSKHSNMESCGLHPMKLTVAAADVTRLLGQIPHDTCRKAAQTHWNVAEDGTVAEESVNWLFCWGKTGMGSAAAACEARRVFDAVLPVTFAAYDAVVPHEYARAHRYWNQAA
jgi:hypothetical protein